MPAVCTTARWIRLFHVTYAWAKLAEYAAGFRKGSHLRVEGELRSREYQNDAGVKVRTYTVVASSIMNLRPGQRVSQIDPETDNTDTAPDDVG